MDRSGALAWMLVLLVPQVSLGDPHVDRQQWFEANCGVVQQEGTRLQGGIGEGPDPVVAIRSAEFNARQAILKLIDCEDPTSLRCQARASVIHQVGSPSVRRDGTQHIACVTLAVRRSDLEQFRSELAEFRAALVPILRRVLASDVVIPGTVWENGCDAGTIGRALQVEVEQGLLEVSQVVTGTPGPDTTTLIVSLAASGGTSVRIDLSAARRDAVAKLGSVTFNPSVLGISALEKVTCVPWAKLGLREANAAGGGGLRVRALFERQQTDFCEGETSRLNVSAWSQLGTKAEGNVALVSTLADGSSLFGGWYTSTQFSSDFTFSSSADGGQEGLLVVAIPSGSDAAPYSQWAAPCRIPGTLSPALVPQDAAVSFVNFTVHPELTGRCGGLSSQYRAMKMLMDARLRTLPTCGSGGER